MAARFLYSPDTYLAVTYTERRKYTPYDLISAVGGLLTYTMAAWFILFGRGKYRSWGLVQRYLLHSSPDAMKKDDSNRLLPITYKDQKDLESQINSGLSPATENSSTPVSVNAYTPSLYYFSATGTPTQQNFPLSPTNRVSSSKSLNKRIDARINLKLWFVEQTLSRHYLSGFRLRNYDVDFKKFGIETYDDDDEALAPPTAHQNWNNFNPSIRTPDQNSLGKFQTSSSLSSSPRGSQMFQKNNNNLNPEEMRTQYPNVTLNQVPKEKKNRVRDSRSGSISTNELTVGKPIDGNYVSSSSSLSSSHFPKIPEQLQPRSNPNLFPISRTDNENTNPTPPLQSITSPPPTNNPEDRC